MKKNRSSENQYNVIRQYYLSKNQKLYYSNVTIFCFIVKSWKRAKSAHSIYEFMNQFMNWNQKPG